MPKKNYEKKWLRALFPHSTLFINRAPCEINSNFGLYSEVESYMEINMDGLKTFCRNMYYKNISAKLYDVSTEDYFVEQIQNEN